MNKKIISKPPNYFYICIIITVLLYFLVPQMNLIPFPINLLGIILMMIGFYFIAKSHYLLKNQNTPDNFRKSTAVVKTGLYKYSRNPMYLGAVIFLLGLSILFGNLISFICPILFFIIINWMFIPYEEEKMEKEMGREYIEYKKTAGRWL